MNHPFRTESPQPSADTVALLRRVRYARSASQEDRLDWVYHPEEVVPATLAHTVWAREDYTRSAALIRVALYLRGLEVARREGYAWNPILDGVYRSRPISPDKFKRLAEQLGEKGVTFRPAHELLEPVAIWLTRTEDPRAAESLLSFRCAAALEVMAKYAPLDVDLLKAALSRNHGLSVHLALNKRLNRDTAAWLGDWCLEQLLSDTGKRILAYGVALKALADSGLRPIGRDEIEALLERVKESPPQRGAWGTPGHRALDLLAKSTDQLTRADLGQLIPYISFNGDYWESIIAAPALDAPLARAALASSRSPKLRQSISRRTDLCGDAKVRAVLLRSGDPSILTRLIEQCQDPAECRRAIRQLIRRHPGMAISYLESGPALVGLLKATAQSWIVHWSGPSASDQMMLV